MKMRFVLFMSTVFMFLSIPTVYGYSDPVSMTLIWQFLASILVGLAFFYKSIKLWILKTFIKSKKNNQQ
ncbi:MAG: hypothetical protein GXY86_00010 [Firmicutes bacterium]|nr:hypothetical protein [Bacillota bacterium]